MTRSYGDQPAVTLERGVPLVYPHQTLRRCNCCTGKVDAHPVSAGHVSGEGLVNGRNLQGGHPVRVTPFDGDNGMPPIVASCSPPPVTPPTTQPPTLSPYLTPSSLVAVRSATSPLDVVDFYESDPPSEPPPSSAPRNTLHQKN